MGSLSTRAACHRAPTYAVYLALMSLYSLSTFLQHLHSMVHIKEVIVGNVSVRDQSIPVGHNGFTVYADFATVGEALAFPTSIVVDEATVKLWHRGKWTCKGCGEQGHTESHCADLGKKKRSNKRRR